MMSMWRTRRLRQCSGRKSRTQKNQRLLSRCRIAMMDWNTSRASQLPQSMDHLTKTAGTIVLRLTSPQSLTAAAFPSTRPRRGMYTSATHRTQDFPQFLQNMWALLSRTRLWRVLMDTASLYHQCLSRSQAPRRGMTQSHLMFANSTSSAITMIHRLVRTRRICM